MPLELSTLDLTDLDLFADGFPHALFAELRRTAPVWWQEPTAHTPDGQGFWVVTRHADVERVARDHTTFSSQTGPGRAGAGGTIIEDMPDGIGPGVMLNMCDPPVHTRIRGLVSRGFTPKGLRPLRPFLVERATAIVDATLASGGECDFLVDVAAELPLQTIAQIMGVPQADRHQLFGWTSTILDYRGRDLGEPSDELAAAGIGMRAYGEELVAERRLRPGDDLVSTVVEGGLGDAELGAFFSLLFTAGSETTRNSIAGGVLACAERPGEWERLRADRSLVPRAVEEILRWTSATAYNRRTATRDVELGGATIRAGEKTTHWYPAANRDESVFAAPSRFDVGRDPNPHLAFGHGIHHCLGAPLARLEIATMVEVLLDRCAGFELAGPVEWGRSNKHTSMRHLPLRLIPG
jgi:cytochrome P450